MTLNEHAQKVRKELFARYDGVNILWRRAEEQLTKHHIPRAVYYELPDDPDAEPDPMAGIQCLAVEKVNGKWRITYGCYPYGEPALGDWKPIVECCAETRVEAAKHFTGLRLAVIKSAEDFIAEVDAASRQLAEAIEQDEQTEELV
ncbi:MAG TPA: hypothetical protein VE988_22410 [Gemmataceae bacterium]|nr:hypothetical protein [Gemmataceae bacterium]